MWHRVKVCAARGAPARAPHALRVPASSFALGTHITLRRYSIMPVAIRRKTIFLGIHDVKFCRLSNVEEPFTDFWQVHISRRLEGKRGTWVTVIPDQFMTLRTTTAERLNN